MPTQVKVSKSQPSFSIRDVEDLLDRAMSAGATGAERVDIHSTPGDRHFDATYYTLSITVET